MALAGALRACEDLKQRLSEKKPKSRCKNVACLFGHHDIIIISFMALTCKTAEQVVRAPCVEREPMAR